jgi:hypothetical protein
MILDWIKRILGKLSKKKAIPVFALPEIRIKQREPKKGELVLGWAFGYDEKTDEKIRELKGMDQKYRATHFYVIGASGTVRQDF